jgi:hypothetical protein
LPVFRDDFERALLELHLEPSPKPERSSVRRAYAQLAKTIRPDDDPNGFQALRQNYETALLGIDDGFYDDYNDDDDADNGEERPLTEESAESNSVDEFDQTQTAPEPKPVELNDTDRLLKKARPNQPISTSEQTLEPTFQLGELEIAQQNEDREIQALRDQIDKWLTNPVQLEDRLLRLTDQLLAHRGMESLQTAFETRSWLLALAAWNENAPLNWLQQLNAHFDLEKTQEQYNQSTNFSEAAIQRIMGRLNAVDQWAGIRMTAATDPKSIASFVLNTDKLLAWLWVRTFWQSFDPLFRTSVDHFLEWVDAIGQYAARDQPSITPAFRRRWDWVKQFAAIGKIKTSLLVFFSSALFSAIITPEVEASFLNTILSLSVGLCLAGLLLWLGGAALRKLRLRLTHHDATLTRIEVLVTNLLLCLLPLIVTVGQSSETDYDGYAFQALSHAGLIPNIVVLTFLGLVIVRIATDVITHQYTLFLQAKAEMLFGLGLLCAIVVWLTSLNSGSNFSLATAVVGIYLFMATLPTSAIQRAGPNFFTWRGGGVLKITPKQTTLGLIGLLVLHIIITQFLTPSVVPNLTREVTSPAAYYVLAASALLLCYATVLACGLPVSGNQGFIIFTFMTVGGSWAFIKTVKETMPLVRFQIADLFLILNLTYSLYITHKSQKEQAS